MSVARPLRAVLKLAAAILAFGAHGSALADGLRLSEIVSGQTRSVLTLPAEAGPAFEARESVLVDMQNRRLFLREGDGTVRLYRVGIGRPEAHLPLGRTRITGKRVDPAWYPTPRARRRDPYLAAYMAPGGDNPIGSRAMTFHWKYYLIHGTNDARKIGRGATWGCVSLYEGEVQDLYERLAHGARVRLEPSVGHDVGHHRLADGPS